MPTLIPQTQPIFWRVKEDDSHGMTLVTEITAVSPTVTAISGEGEMGYLAAIAADGDGYPALPSPGAWLEQGDIYAYGDTLLMVRQSHTRTEHAPENVPALFLVWRGDADEALAWVAGEQVHVGTRRVYDGVLYEALLAHVTQADWTPPAVPALWRVVEAEPEPDEWRVGVAYGVGDVVLYAGRQYRCRQAHTSQAGWTPVAVPALWEEM